MDLQDLKHKRKPLNKMAYKLRIKIGLGKEAQDVAKACARKFRGMCLKVSKIDGAAY